METHIEPIHLESTTGGGDCAVLRVTGEIDVYTAPLLRERVIHLVDEGARHIIVDLRGVTFLDSTGLGVLVGSLKRLRSHEGSLRVVIDADRILRIFRITGLVSVFALHPSVEEAVSADEYWRAAIETEGRTAAEWCRAHGLTDEPKATETTAGRPGGGPGSASP
jgi:anti-sigma B factor antagonist